MVAGLRIVPSPSRMKRRNRRIASPLPPWKPLAAPTERSSLISSSSCADAVSDRSPGRGVPRNPHRRRLKRLQKTIELCAEARSRQYRARVLFLTQQRARHDNVRIDAEHRDSYAAGRRDAPSIGSAKRILVRDDQRRPHLRAQARECRERAPAAAAPGLRNRFASAPGADADVLQSFHHERVVAWFAAGWCESRQKNTRTGSPSSLAARIAMVSAGLSSARCARCIQ